MTAKRRSRPSRRGRPSLPPRRDEGSPRHPFGRYCLAAAILLVFWQLRDASSSLSRLFAAVSKAIGSETLRSPGPAAACVFIGARRANGTRRAIDLAALLGAAAALDCDALYLLPIGAGLTVEYRVGDVAAAAIEGRLGDRRIAPTVDRGTARFALHGEPGRTRFEVVCEGGGAAALHVIDLVAATRIATPTRRGPLDHHESWVMWTVPPPGGVATGPGAGHFSGFDTLALDGPTVELGPGLHVLSLRYGFGSRTGSLEVPFTNHLSLVVPSGPGQSSASWKLGTRLIRHLRGRDDEVKRPVHGAWLDRAAKHRLTIALWIGPPNASGQRVAARAWIDGEADAAIALDLHLDTPMRWGRYDVLLRSYRAAGLVIDGLQLASAPLPR